MKPIPQLLLGSAIGLILGLILIVSLPWVDPPPPKKPVEPPKKIEKVQQIQIITGTIGGQQVDLKVKKERGE